MIGELIKAVSTAYKYSTVVHPFLMRKFIQGQTRKKLIFPRHLNIIRTSATVKFQNNSRTVCVALISKINTLLHTL